MTLRSFKQSILSRLRDRFDLEPSQYATGLKLDPLILLASDVDELLRSYDWLTETKDISAAAGTFIPYRTVPAGKLWRLKRLNKGATTGSSAVIVRVKGVAPSYYITGGITAAYVEDIAVTMEETDQIGMLTTGNGADSARSMTIHYSEEDAF